LEDFMRDGFVIIDADRHVTEPIEMWREYLPLKLRGAAPYLEFERDLPTPRLMLNGEPVMHKLSQRAQLELAMASTTRAGQLQAGACPAAQLAAMDASGIDIAYLLPTFATYLLGVDTIDAALASAFARAYNDWLRGFCGANPARLRGVGLVSPHDPAQMVPELERVAAFGWTAVVMRPNPVKGRLLSNPAYEPFWTACEKLGVAVAIHEGTHTRLPTAGADRFETRFALHACSHPMEQMMALLALIEGGVLERHPRLRVAFLEAGCGWLPYWLGRLDMEYEHLAGEVEEHVRMKPSAYFRRQCFMAAELHEPLLPESIRHIGEDCVLFGTDFPHLDHDVHSVERALALRGVLGEATLRKTLGTNASRFFGAEASA
jgi:predicted TIM-barrel fold metal-dependent hydrolase